MSLKCLQQVEHFAELVARHGAASGYTHLGLLRDVAGLRQALKSPFRGEPDSQELDELHEALSGLLASAVVEEGEVRLALSAEPPKPARCRRTVAKPAEASVPVDLTALAGTCVFPQVSSGLQR